MFKIKKKTLLAKLFIIALIIILPLSGIGCKFTSGEVKEQLRPVSLEVWGVYADSSDLKPLFDIYRQSHPYVTINYRKFRPEEYDDILLNALAEDRGPDIFMIHNAEVYQQLPKIEPLPAEISLPVVVVEGSIKPEEKIVMRTMSSLSTGQLRNSFVDVVYDDVVHENPETGVESIYALPLSMDTLVLYYNTELFNRANIPQPPSSWNQLTDMVEKLTKFDGDDDSIRQSAIALGLADNVNNYFDILSLLMMQNGTVMADQYDRIRIPEIPENIENQTNVAPALNALEFYTSFAKSYKVNYTWDTYMSDALEEFASGNVAMFLGYQYHNEMIQTLAPKLNYSIAPIPQVNSEYPVNYANYWTFGVSKKSEAKNVSWDLLQTMAQADVVKNYLDISGEITVLKSLINEQRSDELGVFLDQILTAKNWYHGDNVDLAKEEFAKLIEIAVTDSYEENLYNEIVNISRRINNTYLR